MTAEEEIEKLKAQLADSAGMEQEAENLIMLLNKYAAQRNPDVQAYIQRLFQIAEQKDSAPYKAWGLLHRAKVYNLKGEFAGSLDIAAQALAIFEQVNDLEGAASSCTSLGIANYFQGNYPEALACHKRALQFNEERKDKDGMASAYNNMGIIYQYQGNYTEAVKSYLLSIQLREEIGAINATAYPYSNLGLIQFEQGNYDDALKNYNRALRVWQDTGDRQGVANLHSSIATIHRDRHRWEEALRCFEVAHQLNCELGNKQGIASTLNNIGLLRDRHGEHQEGMACELQSLKISEEIGDKRMMAYAYGSIGLLHERHGRTDEAIQSALLSLQISEELGDKVLLKNAYKALTKNYKEKRDFENALNYNEKYHAVESEMLGEQAQKQLTSLNFMHNLEQKEKQLEIEHLRNVDLKREHDRSENLLLNILPAEVAEELKEKGTAAAKHFENVTVLFTDFKGFTTISQLLSPQQLVDELHACFSAFDEIMGRYKIEKIKTVGDAYLAVSGLPVSNPNHAEDLVMAAIELRDFMVKRKGREQAAGAEGKPPLTFEVRVGIHSGSVVAGIVGVKKFAYDIWGDTVNTAARMEHNSEAGKINISHTTYQLVKDKFNCRYRGEIEAKNKGKLKMYFVE